MCVRVRVRVRVCVCVCPVRPCNLVTYACLLAGSIYIGHRQWNATVFCPWPSLAR